MRHLNRGVSACVRASLCFVVLASLSAASEPSGATKPRCAFVTVEKSPLAAILESKLLERDSQTWLERSEIDQILAEQELQAAFGATEGANRMALGKLLKADILILMQTGVKNDERYAEVVVAETSGGLRLAARPVLLSPDLEADAAALEQVVDEALGKYGESITEVYAVPPFVSHDLTYEHEHLKAAYAEVLQQALLARPGVLVVELAEAEALAKEFELTTSEEGVTRRLPLYLLGEYRHEGLGDQRQVTITIQLKRGNQQIHESRRQTRPSEAATYLRQTAARLLQTDQPSPALPDAAVEARELADRAAVFLRLADWPEALSLLEASLLLDPDRPDVRVEAVRAATEQIRPATRTDTTEGHAEATRLRRRAFEHCRQVFRAGSASMFAAAMDVYPVRRSIQSNMSFDDFRGNPLVSDETLRQVEALIRDEKSLVDELTERKFESEQWESVGELNLAAEIDFPTERYADTVEFILEHQDKFDEDYKKSFFQHIATKSVERRGFLQQLVDSPDLDEEIRRLAKMGVDYIDKETGYGYLVERPRENAPDEEASTGGLTFRPMNLRYTFEGKEHRFVSVNCLALENGIDLFWQASVLFKVTGKYEKATLLSTHVDQHCRLEYDGRYVWFVGKNSELWVVDPVDEESWEIGPQHGIPAATYENSPGERYSSAKVVVPVSPGEAIVVGEMGRTWLAHVTMSPDGEHQVRVFHEAKESLPTGAESIPRPGESSEVYDNAWRNTRIAFQPGKGVVLPMPRESGSEKPCVFIKRRIASPHFNSTFPDHPLVVDLEDLSVTALENRFRSGARWDIHDGMSYYNDRDATSSSLTLRLMRAGPPDFTPQVVVSDPPIGRLYFQGNVVHIVKDEWWQADLTTGQVESFGPVPWLPQGPRKKGDIELDSISRIGCSNHFGLFANCVRYDTGERIPVQVLFDGSGIALADVFRSSGNLDQREEVGPSSGIVARRTPRNQVLWDTVGYRAYKDLAYSPDGRLIVTVCRQNPCVQVWDASSGQLIADLFEHTYGMRAVAFDRSGKYFATAESENSMYLWSAKDLKLLRSVKAAGKGDVDHPPILAFSFNGDLLVSSLRGEVATVWNVEDGKEVFRMPKHRRVPARAEFTPDGSRLIAFADRGDGTWLWNVASGQPAGSVETLHQPLGFLPSGELLAVGENLDRSLIAWNFGTNTFRVLWPRAPRNVTAVSLDGRYMLKRWGRLPSNLKPSCPRLTVWDVKTRQEVGSTLTAFLAKHWRLSADGSEVVGVGYLGSLWRWDLTRRPANEQMRTWTDKSGEFNVEATFEELTAEGVHLHRKDGRSIIVPLSRLSTADRDFLGSIPTAELSAEPPSSAEDSPQPDDDWIGFVGRPIDPDGDCEFTYDAGKLTIAVPGTHHDLSAEIGKMNAPRVVQEVDADFDATVEFFGEFSPSGAVGEGRMPYHGAGIVVMQDERNYIRLELATIRRPGGELHRYINFELRRDGVVPPGASMSIPVDGNFIRLSLERRGNRFTPSFYSPKTGLTFMPPFRMLLPADLTVGVVAVNGSTTPFAPQFRGFQLRQAKE